MSKRNINVRKHPRKLPTGKVVPVKKHTREIKKTTIDKSITDKIKYGKSKKILEDPEFSDDIMLDLKFDFYTIKHEFLKRDFDEFTENRENLKKTKVKFINDKNNFYRYSDNTVYIGLTGLKKVSRRMARKAIVHEILHAYGLYHDIDIEYVTYTVDDMYTNKIMREIGWTPPIKKDYDDYNKYVNNKQYYTNIIDAKYRIYCPNCDFEQLRKKSSNVILNPHEYQCPQCKGNNLESEEII